MQLHRDELVAAVHRLPEQQAHQRLVPSLTTPISLIKHCAAAERIWFQRTMAGIPVEQCDGPAVGGDGSFHVDPNETLRDGIPEYTVACARSDAIAVERTLDDTAEHPLVGTVTLRFIYLGMIGEITRHADILAEQIRASGTG